MNNSPPSEGSGVVSYRLSKRSKVYSYRFAIVSYFFFPIVCPATAS
ncbi:MAG: hypothetical protein LBC74_10065 [Planctomycetaceae bacterium]|nr:hypothetical protein [Planctomycetaceae bacterium]